jgi:hypothetical protein
MIFLMKPLNNDANLGYFLYEGHSVGLQGNNNMH